MDGREADAAEVARARARAVRWLAAPLTERQLRERLQRRGFSEAAVAAVVAEAVGRGWVDDGEYARRWCERRREQGYGAARIRAELRAKGVAAERVEAALAAEPPGAELAAARRAAARKARALGGIAGERDRARLARHLAGRGFAAEVVWRILEEGAGEG